VGCRGDIGRGAEKQRGRGAEGQRSNFIVYYLKARPFFINEP
jgi:hypothetical protein